MFKRGGIVLLVIFTWACSGSNASPSDVFVFTGQITNATTGIGIAGATITVVSGPDTGKSATTDASGAYVLGGLNSSVLAVSISASGYVGVNSEGVFLETSAGGFITFPLQPQVAAMSPSL